MFFFFFFFNDTATTEIYTLSLHDALPISQPRTKPYALPLELRWPSGLSGLSGASENTHATVVASPDRKSTRLNSSHGYISYAVFCLKKKKKDAGTHFRQCRNVMMCVKAQT